MSLGEPIFQLQKVEVRESILRLQGTLELLRPSLSYDMKTIILETIILEEFTQNSSQ